MMIKISLKNRTQEEGHERRRKTEKRQRED
jgi:hypothetical protein